MMGVGIKPHFVAGLLFFLVSCKALNYDSRLISYQYIDPEKKLIKEIGDFQMISLSPELEIGVMPAYFRKYGSLDNVLVVRLSMKKKYGLSPFFEINSREFGKLTQTQHEWVNNSINHNNLLFINDLKAIDLAERKTRILKDTLILKIGNQKFKFAPMTK